MYKCKYYNYHYRHDNLVLNKLHVLVVCTIQAMCAIYLGGFFSSADMHNNAMHGHSYYITPCMPLHSHSHEET